MIEYKNVVKKYDDKVVLDNLNLKIDDGEFAVLIGASGCGKTTTLKLLNRLIEPTSGEILINGRSIEDIDVEQLRRGIGYVIQQIGLFPNMTLEENICVVPKLLKWDKDRMKDKTIELMEMAGLSYEDYAHKYPNELSGGQQQRIGILRALAADPPIILMDEPFSALDPITRDSLQDEIIRIQMTTGKTILFVTHDMNEAIKVGQKIVFMHEGKILQVGTPDELMYNPENEIVSDFVGKHVNMQVSAGVREDQAANLTCGDVMIEMTTMHQHWGVLSCLNVMQQKNLDYMIVTDTERHYQGYVKVENLMKNGAPGMEIGSLMVNDGGCFKPDDPAQDAYSALFENNWNFVPVVDDEERFLGVITKGAIAKSLAETIWKKEEKEIEEGGAVNE